MITLVLIRHPQTEGNLVSNSEMAEIERPNHMLLLSKQGEIELESTVGEYTNLTMHLPVAVFHSTAFRSRVLAYKFSRDFNVNCIEDSRLNEKWDGIFHSLHLNQIKERYPEQIDLKEKYGWYHYRPPGGESGPDVEMRIRSFLRDLVENQAYVGQQVIIVGHGNWFHLFEKIAENKPWEYVERNRIRNPFPNGSITVYDFYPPTRFVKRLDRYVPEDRPKIETKYA